MGLAANSLLLFLMFMFCSKPFNLSMYVATGRCCSRTALLAKRAHRTSRACFPGLHGSDFQAGNVTARLAKILGTPAERANANDDRAGSQGALAGSSDNVAARLRPRANRLLYISSFRESSVK